MLARDILSYSLSCLPELKGIRFLDPAIGTGSFYSALLAATPSAHIEAAEGFEVDEHYERPARELWSQSSLRIHHADFTQAIAPSSECERFNLLICNPPYVRHHHIVNGEKLRLQEGTKAAFGTRIDGLAGLYCYFLALAHSWMRKSAIACWLVPSEFMNVNYGKAVKRYLLNKVTLLHIHRFDPNDTQFADALVSSAVVLFRNDPPSSTHVVNFSYGGTLNAPSLSKCIAVDELRREPKWTRFPVADIRKPSSSPKLKDFFHIKRGLVTGDNQFFILSRQYIEECSLPWECFRPILPSPRYLQEKEIVADKDGNPILEKKLFLLDCRLPEEQIKVQYPALWKYLQTGKPTVSSRYLCKHRKPWYIQEERPPPPFVCTYIGRSDTKKGKPFRFILNCSKATAANVYLLLYPKPILARALEADSTLARKVWEILDAIEPADLLDESRVYGGGLHKLEPKELANVNVDNLGKLLATNPQKTLQLGLFD